MSLNFATREIESQPIVGIRATTSMEEIAQVIGALFGEVMDYFNQNGLAPAGMPFTIYHEMDRDRLDMECGMPVASAVEGTERVRSGELPAGKMVTVTHMGPLRAVGTDVVGFEGLDGETGAAGGGSALGGLRYGSGCGARPVKMAH